MGYTAIVDYGVGNLKSVTNAMAYLGLESRVTGDAGELERADAIILPGVGAFPDAAEKLRGTGLDKTIVAQADKKPILGICLGMQLMCSSSEEGDTDCLGIFPVRVKLFPKGMGFKVPHVGWNTIECLDDSVYRHTAEGEYVYFVHSYYAPLSEFTSAVTEYGGIRFSASLRKDNFHCLQFHPEKSGKAGDQMLRSFLEET